MEITVKERLIEFIKFKKKSIREFERLCNLSNGYVKGIKYSILPEKMRGISLQYPELNIVWLVTGEGEMLKPTKNNFGPLTNDQLEAVVEDGFFEKLMEMYNDGEIFPAKVVERMRCEYNAKIDELNSTILSLQRRIWELENKDI